MGRDLSSEYPLRAYLNTSRPQFASGCLPPVGGQETGSDTASTVVSELCIKSRSIIFAGREVCAILAGLKTQTRRVVLRPERYSRIRGCAFACRYGKPGDRLWVAEKWAHEADGCTDPRCGSQAHLWYYSTESEEIRDAFAARRIWRSSRYMPRWASRIVLELTEVRVQQLQEISEWDARAEGAPRDVATISVGGRVRYSEPVYRYGFEVLWDETNEERGYGWGVNPWVWCLTFRRLKGQET